jgi:hypothetical protein
VIYPSSPPTSLSSIPPPPITSLLPFPFPLPLPLPLSPPPPSRSLPPSKLCISTPASAPLPTARRLHCLNTPADSLSTAPPALTLLNNGAGGALGTGGGGEDIKPPTSWRKTDAPPVFALSSSGAATGAGKLSKGELLRRRTEALRAAAVGVGPIALPRLEGG